MKACKRLARLTVGRLQQGKRWQKMKVPVMGLQLCCRIALPPSPSLPAVCSQERLDKRALEFAAERAKMAEDEILRMEQAQAAREAAERERK
eukprot:188644-Chlamydomonas_euryale.AAC.1